MKIFPRSGPCLHLVTGVQGSDAQGNEWVDIQSDAVTSVETVRLYHETVLKVIHGHPETPGDFPSILSAVSKAVQEPTVVLRSYSNSFVYVDHATTNRLGQAFVVPVKTVCNVSGRVKSYYFADVDYDDEDVVVDRR